MNNEYYGAPSTPTEDFLMHYGVKGMKWGVRRARERGNGRALGRHYAKAARKLERLTARTDRDLVRRVKKQNARNALPMAAASGIASGAGTFAINGHVKDMKKRALFSAAVGGGAALASGMASGIDNLRLRRMLSDKGYQKNLAKRKEFEKEMRSAFKGTKYGRQIDSTKRQIGTKIGTMKKTLTDYERPVKSKKRRR